MRRCLSLPIMLLFALFAHGQADGLGSWNILNIRQHLNSKVSLFGEAQLRSLRFYDDFHYYEYKGGVNYTVQKGFALALGMGSYQTYREGGNFVLPKNNDEFRIWPQVALQQSVGKFKIEQRYRMEMRFTSNGYRNRFRYRLGLSHAFGKEKNSYRPFLASVSNELFFTNKEPYFERNRLAFSIQYKPSKITAIQIGYLHQFDYRINDETGRDFLQVGYFIELFRQRQPNARIESSIKDE